MVTIETLIGGNITITTGGSAPAGHAETIFTFSENRTASNSISGELGNSIWKFDEDNGMPMLNYEGPEKLPPWDLVSVDIGNTVTGIGDSAFSSCGGLTSMTIPDFVTNIGDGVFFDCSNLTSVTFEGKDRATVQGMTDYPFGLNYANENGVTIHCTDGDIEVQYEG